MSQQINFEGQTHEFPDDFTDADIAKALGTKPAPGPAASAEPESFGNYLERRTRPTAPAKTAIGNAWDQTVGRASRAFTEFGKDIIGGSPEAPLPGGSIVPEGVSRHMAAAANPIPETMVQAGAMAAVPAAGPLVGLAARTGMSVATLQAYPWLARVLAGAAGGELGGELSGETPGVGAVKGGGAAAIGEAAGRLPVAAVKVYRSTEAGRRAVNAADAARVGTAMGEVAPTLKPGTTAAEMQRTAEGQGLQRIGPGGKEPVVQEIEAALSGAPAETPKFTDATGKGWVYENGWRAARAQGEIPIPSMGRSMPLREANNELSSIGDQMRGIKPLDPRFPKDVDIKQEYGKLAEEIKSGIQQVAGPEAAAKWAAAQAQYRAGRFVGDDLLGRPSLFNQGQFTASDLQKWLKNPANRADLAQALGGNLKTGENLGPYNRLVDAITRGAEPGMVDAARGLGFLDPRGSWGSLWAPVVRGVGKVLPNAPMNYVGAPGRVPFSPGTASPDVQRIIDMTLQRATP